MKPPHHEQATVPEQKIVAYLLSLTHEDGRSKALFFSSFGFAVARWEELADALKQHARANEVVEVENSDVGTIMRLLARSKHLMDAPLLFAWSGL